MRPARYRAVPLDGFTIVLDLVAADYLAIPRGSAEEPDRDALAEMLGADVKDILVVGRRPVPAARRDLDGVDGETSQRADARDWLRLLRIAPGVLWALRFGSPRSWIMREGEQMPASNDDAVAAARRFRNMRPFLPRLSRCLPHSLLLRSFLAAGGHDAFLVIGVRLFPFEAHSWLQAGDIVLTDDLEQTAAYTPIAIG